VFYGRHRENANLLVVLFVSAAGLDEDETMSAFGLLLAQPFSLSVFDRERVGVPVHVFERGEDFGHVPLDDFEERNDHIKARERQDHGVRCCWHHWGQNRETSHDSEGAFRANE
jgi:hypothetical protein